MQQPLLNTVNSEIGGFYFSEYGEYGKQYKVLLNIKDLRDFTLDYEDVARGDAMYEKYRRRWINYKNVLQVIFINIFRTQKQPDGLYTLYQQEDSRSYEYIYKKMLKKKI